MCVLVRGERALSAVGERKKNKREREKSVSTCFARSRKVKGSNADGRLVCRPTAIHYYVNKRRLWYILLPSPSLFLTHSLFFFLFFLSCVCVRVRYFSLGTRTATVATSRIGCVLYESTFQLKKLQQQARREDNTQKKQQQQQQTTTAAKRPRRKREGDSSARPSRPIATWKTKERTSPVFGGPYIVRRKAHLCMFASLWCSDSPSSSSSAGSH